MKTKRRPKDSNINLIDKPFARDHLHDIDYWNKLSEEEASILKKKLVEMSGTTNSSKEAKAAQNARQRDLYNSTNLVYCAEESMGMSYGSPDAMIGALIAEEEAEKYGGWEAIDAKLDELDAAEKRKRDAAYVAKHRQKSK